MADHNQSPYWKDSFRWMEIQREIAYIPHNSSILDEIQSQIITNKDSGLAYFFAYHFDYKRHKMQDVVLQAKNPKYAFIFAQNIPNADIQALQDVIIKSKNMTYITKFACFVPDADKKKIECLILKEGTARCAHMFIKHIDDIDFPKFKQIIFKSQKPRYLFELAKHLTSRRDIARIEDIIIKLRSFTYIRLLAQKVRLANVFKLEQAVIETANVKEIKKFARVVKKSKMRHLSALF